LTQEPTSTSDAPSTASSSSGRRGLTPTDLAAERRLLNSARYRAKRDGLPFGIDLDDIVIPERCPILGVVLNRSGGPRNNATPSLDKIVPEHGYTKGNVVVVCWRANRLKSSAGKTELAALARFYAPQLLKEPP